jgi:hypothetical protein
LAAYANSLGGPFIFDDLRSIASNPTLHPLWPPGGVLHPPPGTTVSGRPLLNLSFAVDRALWGGEVPGYHAVNLLIHLLAGLILFGLVRRTWMRTKPAEGAVGASARAGTCIGFATALLWTVHPLQTESVTYLAQRAESLMGLLYFATLYSLVRGLSAAGRRRGTGWLALSVAACGAGMAVKEVMVTAPVLALLYDRTFAAGSFGAAVRRRALYYAALAACWLVLGGLMVQAGGNRNGSIGFGIGVSPWAYALTQLVAIPRYLELCFWPHPLMDDVEAPAGWLPGLLVPRHSGAHFQHRAGCDPDDRRAPHVPAAGSGDRAGGLGGVVLVRRTSRARPGGRGEFRVRGLLRGGARPGRGSGLSDSQPQPRLPE